MVIWSLRGPRVVAGTLVAAVLMHAASCGFIIHPERVGQPHRGRLDPAIVVLDALGLLLFFVPGVIAFIVDFATGTIYLPAYDCAQKDGLERQGEFVVVRLDPKTMTRERIEAVLRDKTGKSVRLEPGSYEAQRLERLDEFRTRSESLARSSERTPAKVLFRAQSRE